MNRTLEDTIAGMAPEGKENAAIEEVKRALVKQILQHPKHKIHEHLNWVHSDTPDTAINGFMMEPDIPVIYVILILAKLVN